MRVMRPARGSRITFLPYGCLLEARLAGMGYEDEISKGVQDERRRAERKQQQDDEQERHAEKRAAHAAGLWPYLERYRQAARARNDPDTIECAKPRMLGSGSKASHRRAWLISRHSGAADNIGQRITFSLWLDDETTELWWRETGFRAHRVSLGTHNPHLSPDENQALEDAEKYLARNLGMRAEQLGISGLLLAAGETR
jgi:hypothetical protein